MNSNTYEYSTNATKKLGTNQEPKSGCLDVKSKSFIKPDDSATKNDEGGNIINRDSQVSNTSN